MPAYIILEIDIHDRPAFERYRAMAPPTLAAYGGRYLVRGGACETLEGDWRPPRFVILEFPDSERARAWWSSPEYAEGKALRQASATSQMLLVEGVPAGFTP